MPKRPFNAEKLMSGDPNFGSVTHYSFSENHWAWLPASLGDPARAADSRWQRLTRCYHPCAGPQLANPLESPTSVAHGLGELVEELLPLSYAYLRAAAAR